jgi:hypothetical protein
MKIPEWVKANFDKLLMSTLFLVMIGVFIHCVHHGVDAGSVSWLQTTAGQVLAALFTLVVSKGQAQRSTDINTTGPTLVTTTNSEPAPPAAPAASVIPDAK